MTVVHSDIYVHTHEPFFNVSVVVGLGSFCEFVWIWHFVLFRFSLDYFVRVLLAFVTSDLVSSLLCQEIGREECLQDDLFCVEWDVNSVGQCMLV